MTAVFQRRAAHEFALALESSSRSAGPDLAPLLDVVESLRPIAAGGPAPSLEFRDTLRQRLIAVGTVAPPSAVPIRARHASSRGRLDFPGPWRRRLVAAGAGATLLLGTFGGVAAASAHALPGDALYSVKRTIEDFRLSLAGSDRAKGQQYLDLAQTRLGETERLLDRTGPQPTDQGVVRKLRTTLSDVQGATQHGSGLLTAVYQRTGDREPLTLLQSFTQQERDRVNALAPLLPPELASQPAALLALLNEIDAQISDLIASGAPGATTGDNAGTSGVGASATQRPTPPPGSALVPGLPSSGATASPTPTPGGGGGGGVGVQLPGVTITAQPPGGSTSTSQPGSGASIGVNLPPLLPSGDPSLSLTIPPLLPGLPGVGLSAGQ